MSTETGGVYTLVVEGVGEVQGRWQGKGWPCWLTRVDQNKPLNEYEGDQAKAAFIHRWPQSLYGVKFKW